MNKGLFFGLLFFNIKDCYYKNSKNSYGADLLVRKMNKLFQVNFQISNLSNCVSKQKEKKHIQ